MLEFECGQIVGAWIPVQFHDYALSRISFASGIVMILTSPRAYIFYCAPQSSQYLYIIIMEILRLRCSDNVFYVTIGDADIECLGLSLHSLISICILYHTMVCELDKNRIIQTIQSFELIWQQKMVNRFWQSVDAILEDVSAPEATVWYKTINLKTTNFQCSKNYGVARLEVAPTMTDLISLKENKPFPFKIYIFCALSQISTFFLKSIYICDIPFW